MKRKTWKDGEANRRGELITFTPVEEFQLGQNKQAKRKRARMKK